MKVIDNMNRCSLFVRTAAPVKGEATLFIDIVKVVILLDTKVILVGKGVVLGNFNWLANSLVGVFHGEL